jgi:cyclin C
MEFYLLEDLDFHLIVFHPYRALLHICGREPADGGKFDKARVEEDVEVRRKETEARKRREEEARRAAGAGIKPNDKAAGVLGESGRGAGGRSDKADEEESEEKRIRRLMGRGTGEGLMEIEEGVLQICL